MGLIGWPELLVIVALLIVVAPLLAIYLIVRAAGRKNSGKGGGMSADETQIIQQIHQGLERMEKRIEAVETIVLDSSEKTPEALNSKE